MFLFNLNIVHFLVKNFGEFIMTCPKRKEQNNQMRKEMRVLATIEDRWKILEHRIAGRYNKFVFYFICESIGIYIYIFHATKPKLI